SLLAALANDELAAMTQAAQQVDLDLAAVAGQRTLDSSEQALLSEAGQAWRDSLPARQAILAYAQTSVRSTARADALADDLSAKVGAAITLTDRLVAAGVTSVAGLTEQQNLIQQASLLALGIA